jgi:hypothetical protein
LSTSLSLVVAVVVAVIQAVVVVVLAVIAVRFVVKQLAVWETWNQSVLLVLEVQLHTRL